MTVTTPDKLMMRVWINKLLYLLRNTNFETLTGVSFNESGLDSEGSDLIIANLQSIQCVINKLILFLIKKAEKKKGFFHFIKRSKVHIYKVLVSKFKV